MFSTNRKNSRVETLTFRSPRSIDQGHNGPIDDRDGQQTLRIKRQIHTGPGLRRRSFGHSLGLGTPPYSTSWVLFAVSAFGAKCPAKAAPTPTLITQAPTWAPRRSPTKRLMIRPTGCLSKNRSTGARSNLGVPVKLRILFGLSEMAWFQSLNELIFIGF